jgi:ferrous iron transport protein B
LLGIIISILSALHLNRIFFKGEHSELLMELPSYRMPALKGALIHMWERGKLFLYKACTMIFVFVPMLPTFTFEQGCDWLLSSPF